MHTHFYMCTLNTFAHSHRQVYNPAHIHIQALQKCNCCPGMCKGTDTYRACPANSLHSCNLFKGKSVGFSQQMDFFSACSDSEPSLQPPDSFLTPSLRRKTPTEEEAGKGRQDLTQYSHTNSLFLLSRVALTLPPSSIFEH